MHAMDEASSADIPGIADLLAPDVLPETTTSLSEMCISPAETPLLMTPSTLALADAVEDAGLEELPTALPDNRLFDTIDENGGSDPTMVIGELDTTQYLTIVSMRAAELRAQIAKTRDEIRRLGDQQHWLSDDQTTESNELVYAQAQIEGLQQELCGLSSRHVSSFATPPLTWREHYVMSGQSETVFVLPSHLVAPRSLGQGTYGDVVEAVDLRGPFNRPAEDGSGRMLPRKVVVKKLRQPWIITLTAKRTFRELHMLRYIREKWVKPEELEDDLSDLAHENIIPMLDCYIPPYQYRSGQENLYIVMGHGEQSLEKVMEIQTVSESHAAWFGYSILRALKYMHSAGILHRDLKPGNISISSSCNLRILDFGLARVGRPGSEESSEGYVVTRYYRGPEVILQWKNHSTSLDIWSFGVIFAEMLIRDALNRHALACRQKADEFRMQFNECNVDKVQFPEEYSQLEKACLDLERTYEIAQERHYSFKLLFKGRDRIDQLRVIARVIGWPDESYINQIDEHAVEWIRAEVKRMPAQRRPFDEIPEFSGLSPLALDLLEKTLRWDPKTRITAAEACRHPFFANMPEQGGHDLHRAEDEPEVEPGSTFDDSYESIHNLDPLQWRARCIHDMLEFRKFRQTRERGEEVQQIATNANVCDNPRWRAELLSQLATFQAF